MTTQKKVNIKFQHEIIAAYGLDQEKLILLFQDLGGILKKQFEALIPTDIDGTLKMDRVLELHKVFTRTSTVLGFDRHLKIYENGKTGPNLFVAKVVNSLIDRAENIVFEPEVTSPNGRNPDIKFEILGQTIFAECKSVLTTQFNNRSRHVEIYEIIEKYCECPHQISLNYKKEISNPEVEAIGESIKKMLPNVTSSGKIIHNANIEVDLQFNTHYNSVEISSEMEGMLEDNNDGNRMSWHVFLIKGKSISIAGPEIDFSNVIKDKIDDSRTQSIDGHPFITILNTDLFLGKKNENIRAVTRLFQPERNRRISGVLFANSETLVNGKFEHFVPNPFANYPLNKDAEIKLII